MKQKRPKRPVVMANTVRIQCEWASCFVKMQRTVPFCKLKLIRYLRA